MIINFRRGAEGLLLPVFDSSFTEGVWSRFGVKGYGSRGGIVGLKRVGCMSLCCDSVVKGFVFEVRVGVHVRAWWCANY